MAKRVPSKGHPLKPPTFRFPPSKKTTTSKPPTPTPISTPHTTVSTPPVTPSPVKTTPRPTPTPLPSPPSEPSSPPAPPVIIPSSSEEGSPSPSPSPAPGSGDTPNGSPTSPGNTSESSTASVEAGVGGSVQTTAASSSPISPPLAGNKPVNSATPQISFADSSNGDRTAGIFTSVASQASPINANDATQSSVAQGPSGHLNLAAKIGGAIGGTIAGLLLIILGIFLCKRKGRSGIHQLRSPRNSMVDEDVFDILPMSHSNSPAPASLNGQQGPFMVQNDGSMVTSQRDPFMAEAWAPPFVEPYPNNSHPLRTEHLQAVENADAYDAYMKSHVEDGAPSTKTFVAYGIVRDDDTYKSGNSVITPLAHPGSNPPLDGVSEGHESDASGVPDYGDILAKFTKTWKAKDHSPSISATSVERE